MQLDKSNVNDNIHYMYPATITSQWQMSIPAPVRDVFAGWKKVVVYKKEDALVVRPVKDLLSLAGSFKTKKKYNQKAIDEGFAKYLGERGALIK